MKSVRYPLLWLLLAVVLIKGGLFLWGWQAYDMQQGQLRNWLSVWDHGDAGPYKIIAAQGYFPEGVPEAQKALVQRFPPLYPMLIRLVSVGLSLSAVISGIAISLGCFLASSALLYRLCLDEGLKVRQAVAAVLLFSLYPTGFVTHAVYAESLFILCVLGSFVAMRRGWFWLAGVAAAGAILTRVLGVALLPAIAVALFLRWREGRLRWFDGSALLFPVLALGGYLLMNAWWFGSPLHAFRAYLTGPAPMTLQWPMQESCQQVWRLWQRAWAGTVDGAYMLGAGWNPVFVFFCLGMLVVWIRHRPRWDLVAYALCALGLVTMMGGNASLPRHTLAVVPMFLALGQVGHPVVQVCLGGAFGFLLLRFVTVFVNGAWAF